MSVVDIDALLAQEGKTPEPFQFSVSGQEFSIAAGVKASTIRRLGKVDASDFDELLLALLGDEQGTKLLELDPTDLQIKAIMEAYQAYKGVSLGE